VRLREELMKQRPPWCGVVNTDAAAALADNSLRAVRLRALRRSKAGGGAEQPEEPLAPAPPPPQQRRAQSARASGRRGEGGKGGKGGGRGEEEASGDPLNARGQAWMATVGLDPNRLPVSLSLLEEQVPHLLGAGKSGGQRRVVGLA
jgi:hypothetical protein